LSSFFCLLYAKNDCGFCSKFNRHICSGVENCYLVFHKILWETRQSENFWTQYNISTHFNCPLCSTINVVTIRMIIILYGSILNFQLVFHLMVCSFFILNHKFLRYLNSKMKNKVICTFPHYLNSLSGAISMWEKTEFSNSFWNSSVADELIHL
jgi:hypothetical protein